MCTLIVFDNNLSLEVLQVVKLSQYHFVDAGMKAHVQP